MLRLRYASLSMTKGCCFRLIGGGGLCFPTHATLRLCHGWGTHFSCGLARLSAALPVGDFNSFEGRLNLTNH